MKKNFKFYLITWIALFILFNIIVFVTPKEIFGINKFTGSFWVGYIFIFLTFIIQLICAFVTLNGEKEKVFLNFPLFNISVTSLLVMVIIGTICMAIPLIPNWIAIIACCITLCLSIISLAGAKAVGEMVGDIDKKTKENTFFIKSLMVDAKSLVDISNDEDIKTETKKVYEAIRFSDPVSNEKLSNEEFQISAKFAEFSGVVSQGNVEEVRSKSAELLYLIDNRNNKCKLYK